MRALCFDGHHARVMDRPEPAAGEGFALVQPILAGICNTDLEILRGYLGFRGVLGHELVGRVAQGPAKWLGRRVVAEINFACGSCPSCTAGQGRHCPYRTVMGIAGQDGGFAERVAVPVANLHAVAETITDEQAVFVEPLAAAMHILEQVDRSAGGEALVLGDGKLGLLAAQALAAAGLKVLCVGKHADHLEILRRRGIATALLGEWGREPAALVVEATGSAKGLSLALEAARPTGTVVLKSTVADRGPVDLNPAVIGELTLVGSRCGPFEPAIAALSEGSVAVTPLIAARYALAQGERALAHARQRGVLKVLLEVRPD